MITFASMFSGFGGADCGAIAAGMIPTWGIELDPKIAAVANRNLGEHVRVADILDCNPVDFPAVDVLHASPPCPNFSQAKTGGGETELDIALARKVAAFITTLQPRIFTLENVWGYRNSRSWAIIRETLNVAGYWHDIAHVNAADYGVPQTRKRMIVRAIRGAWVPMLSEPETWIGWYAAIEDLIDDLPDTEFAPWQLARLPEEIKETLMLWNMGQTIRPVTTRSVHEPVHTVDTGMMRRPSSIPQAVLIGGGNRSEAFLQYAKENRPSIPGRKEATEPSMAISATASGDMRAFLVGKNNDAGRVVAMTPRCLARFQSFPDWFVLPESKTLAVKGIGNAVPPLLMEKLYRQLPEY